MTAVLVSRFLLDLQDINQSTEKGSTSSRSDSATEPRTLRFATVIGSLGSNVSRTEDVIAEHLEYELEHQHTPTPNSDLDYRFDTRETNQSRA